MEFEIVKWFGEDWKRETFPSLTQRKASLEEFTYNGFIQINEQPERSKREDQTKLKRCRTCGIEFEYVHTCKGLFGCGALNSMET